MIIYMSKNFLDELNKLAGSAFSSAVQAKDSLIEFIKEHVDSFMSSKNMVSRDEFEALKETVMKLQKENSKKTTKKKEIKK